MGVKPRTRPFVGLSHSLPLAGMAKRLRPFSTVTERHKRLGQSAHRGTKIRRSLLEKRLVAEEQSRVPEGSVTLPELIEPGKALARIHGAELKPFPKNASLEHEYWKRRIAANYRRRGHTVEEEVPIGAGKALDLVATRDGERIAIEVETGKSDARANLAKRKGAGFHKLLTIETTRSGYRGGTQRTD